MQKVLQRSCKTKVRNKTYKFIHFKFIKKKSLK